ncbi:ATP-binding cassette domain-containing protein [Cohnella sp.]|uniref:ATP-binding cassette domain-containing protein n=1 Tax=Cohnella sp. TaxID=1883426 RepID=UPI003561F56D
MKDMLKFLFVQFARYPWQSATLFLLMIITLAYQVTFSYSFKTLIDDILIPRQFDKLILFLSYLVAGAILSSGADLAADTILLKTGLRMQDELRYRIFRHMQMLPESYYRRQSPSSVVARLSTDLNTMHATFLALISVINAGLGLLFSLTLLYVMNKWFFLLLIVGLPICFIIPKLMNRSVMDASDLYKTRENFNEIILDRLTFHQIIRGFGLQAWEHKRLVEMTDEVAPMGFKAQLLRTMMGKSVAIALLMLNVTLIAVGAYLSRYDLMTIGILVSFQSFYLRISSYASSLTRYFPQFVQATLSWGRLSRVILSQQTNPAELTETISPIPMLSSELELSHVSFGYTEFSKSLNNINLTFPHGMHCSVVGSSGSGKTSIVNLLMRYYEPNEGSILMDGIDVRDLPLDAYRRMIAYVPQEIVLFNSSLRENIRVGRLTATDEEVEAAAKSADIHEWIASQPGGYEAMVGERGRFLSGGQKQRIALARAFVRNSSILLLDEASSALDPGTEQAINDSLGRISDSATIISVTHRLQTIEHTNRIFVMHKGELAGVGTHSELLKNCSVYQNLWSKQSGFVISDDGTSADILPERLKLIPLFQSLDEIELAEIQKRLVTEKVEAGVTIMKQGEEGNRFYIIVRGQVEVLQHSGFEEDRSLAVLEDGDHFGEMALLKQIPRTATIRTLTPCVLLTMHREWFQEAIEHSPQLKLRLENSYAERILIHR